MPPAFDVAINGGTLVLPAGPVVGNLGIRNGRLVSIASEPLAGDETLDVTGRIVLPGGIDPHVHFRMSQGSMVTSDDYATGSRSAACGGITTYIDFAVQPSGGSAPIMPKRLRSPARPRWRVKPGAKQPLSICRRHAV